MDKKKEQWSIFLICELLLYLFLVLKILRWNLSSQNIGVSLTACFLTLMLIMISFVVGVIVVKMEISENNKNAVVWGILSSIVPIIGIYRTVILKRWKNLGLLIIISLIGGVLFFGSLIREIEKNDVVNTGTIFLNYENKIGNQLTLDFKSATDGFVEKKRFKLSSKKEMIYINGKCSKGSFLIEIVQGNKSRKQKVEQGRFKEKISLDFLNKGYFNMKIHIQNAKDTSLKVEVK
ncbi:hypothetical protein ACFFRT_00515 [Enterococcus thailandicus]|nr:hypothetical protein [Enterococcus thailandicus]OJG93934.1 hypothetical protein RV17_GL000913 [Enterococcus thailandicus]